MKVLVTGATGYIGRNIVQKLLTAGHYCRCLVRHGSDVEFLRACSNVELHYGDISQKESLTGICKGIDVVINSAGILGKWNSTINDLGPVNTNGIINLFGELNRNDVSYVIHLSAGGVTGPVRGAPADESYECRPQTPYEETKLGGERNALNLFEHYNIPVVVVRPTFTYGPEDPHKLPLFRAIKQGKFFFVGSSESTNHPVYIDDLVAGILLLFQRRPVGGIYIIGGGTSVTKRELVSAIAEELGIESNFACLPRWVAAFSAKILGFSARLFNFDPVITPSRISMLADNWGYSIAKAKRELGYRPEVDLRKGIKKTIMSYTRLQWL